MSYDLAVWFSSERMSSEKAGQIYIQVLEENSSELEPSERIDSFYQELTEIYPEIDDVPEERIDDVEYCPWSVELDKSDRHITMSAVWSQAERVNEVVHRLAKKHGLAVYDPQTELLTLSDGGSPRPNKSWWKFW